MTNRNKGKKAIEPLAKVVVKDEGSWTFEKSNSLTHLTRVHNSKNDFRGLDTMGSYWILGIAEIRSGKIQYITKNKTIEILEGRYLFWLPPWSLVHSQLFKLNQHLVALVHKVDESYNLKPAFISKEWKGRLPESEKEIVKFIKNCNECIEIEFNTSPSGFAQKAKRMIDLNFDKAISMDKIAKTLKTSSTVFGRIFKKEYGVSPLQYRNHLRVTLASFELLKGNSVTRVAENMGFNDLSRFNKSFKATTRTQPNQFKPKKSKNAKF